MLITVVNTALAYYMQFTILIPAVAVGLIFIIARIWDGLNDFFMGNIVDKTRSKWGKCRPYLLFVPIPISILTMLCFTNFGFYGKSSVMDVIIVSWAVFIYVLWGMVYTMGDIPLWSITSLITEDDKDRNKLISLARITGGLGAGVVTLSVIPLALFFGQLLAKNTGNSANGERWGFFISASIFAVFGGLLFQLIGFRVKERVVSSEKKYTLKENFKIIINNKPFKQIIYSGLLGSPKMLIMIAAIPLITYYFASKSPSLSIFYMALLGAGSFLGMFLLMAITPMLLRRFSKKNLYNYSNLISVVPFLMIFVIYLIAPRGSIATSPVFLSILVICFIVCGGSSGIFIVLQTSMIADCVDYEEHKTKIRPDGIFFAGLTFLAKLTGGLAAIMSGVAYAVVGFSGENIGKLNDYIDKLGWTPEKLIAEGLNPADYLLLPREMPIYDNYMMILFFLISVPPAIGCLLSVIPTWKYALDDDVHKKIVDELNDRRHSL